MEKLQYIYRFRQGGPIEEIGGLLLLAALAVESLHGRSGMRLDGTFLLKKNERICTVNAATEVGRDLARIFTGFLTHHVGEKSFRVSLVSENEPTPVKGGAR